MARPELSDQRTASSREGHSPRRAHLQSVPPRQAAREAVDEETQGNRLARLIQGAGLNNNRLAKLSGVRRETISRVVNDHAALGPKLAERLAPPLGVTVDELVLPGTPPAPSRSTLEVRVRELEEDRDFLLHVIRKVLAHLDKVGVGAPHVPAAPRSAASIVRAPGLTAQDGRESIDVPPGQRRPGLPRHR